MSIFNQLGKIVTNSGGQTAPEQSRSAYLDNLEQSRAEITENLSNLFAALGKAYYEGHTENPGSEYEAQFTAIQEAYADIARCQQQVEEISACRRCPSCGAELAEGSAFCNFCGTKLSAAIGAEKQGQKVCPKCQAVLCADDIFCTACGADLRK